MSAILTLKNQIEATKNDRDTMTREIAERENKRHSMNLKLDELEEALSNIEQAERDAKATLARYVAAAVEEPALLITPVAEPVMSTLPVFCTGDSNNLKHKQMKISDFKDIIAFSYELMEDLNPHFITKSKEQFIDYLTTRTRRGSAHQGMPEKLITKHDANKIYTFMKTASDNIGKEIVVAVGCIEGKKAGYAAGGLEIRKITGSYRYTESFRYASGDIGYMHQFPTEFVRRLSNDESKAVTSARPTGGCGPFALNWNIRLTL